MKSYSEYLLEYETDSNMLYFSGLDEDGFWDELKAWDDINNIVEFAEGYAQRLRDEGFTVQIVDITE